MNLLVCYLIDWLCWCLGEFVFIFGWLSDWVWLGIGLVGEERLWDVKFCGVCSCWWLDVFGEFCGRGLIFWVFWFFFCFLFWWCLGWVVLVFVVFDVLLEVVRDLIYFVVFWFELLVVSVVSFYRRVVLFLLGLEICL